MLDSCSIRAHSHQVVGHKKFLEFVCDFNLTKSSMITSHDMGAIFMASQKTKHMDDPGCLTFEEFWEALCRCALVAYADKQVDLPEKLKALFLLMTREIKWSDANDGSHLRSVDSNPHHFYLGAKQFQNAVVGQWMDDGKPDYINGPAGIGVNPNLGRDLLKRMSSRSNVSSRSSKSASPKPGGVLSSAAGASAGTKKTEADPVRKSNSKDAASTADVWREVHDQKTGRNYYYNTSTRATTWIDPRGERR